MLVKEVEESSRGIVEKKITERKRQILRQEQKEIIKKSRCNSLYKRIQDLWLP